MVFSFPSLMRQAIFWCHFTEQPILSQRAKLQNWTSANKYFSWLPRTGNAALQRKPLTTRYNNDQVLCQFLEGHVGGKGGSRWIQNICLWLTYTAVHQKSTQFCKAPLPIKNSKKKILPHNHTMECAIIVPIFANFH